LKGRILTKELGGVNQASQNILEAYRMGSIALLEFEVREKIFSGAISQ
jgi:hypothetical protein